MAGDRRAFKKRAIQLEEMLREFSTNPNASILLNESVAHLADVAMFLRESLQTSVSLMNKKVDSALKDLSLLTSTNFI